MVEPVLLERAGSEVLEHHVARQRELTGERGAALGLQVERHGALPCVDPREVDAHRVVAHLGLEEADDVAPRRFELHHVGAEVGEHAPADRTGDDLRQVEDADPFEWASVDVVVASCVRGGALGRELLARRIRTSVLGSAQ